MRFEKLYITIITLIILLIPMGYHVIENRNILKIR